MATSDWNGEKIKEDEEFYIVNGNIVDKNELEEQEETVYYDCDGKTYFEDEVECFENISRAIENIKKGYVLRLIVIQKITIRFI